MNENDKRVAEMTYSLADAKIMIIDHTWVDESLREKKLGNKLVEKGVEFARERGYKIIPLCSFAKKLLTRDKTTYSDVLHV